MRHLLNFSLRHLSIATLLLCTVSLIASSAKSTDEVSRKADYIYLEAVNAYEDNRFDDYFNLLRHALTLEPRDPYIRGAIAEIEIMNPNSDSTIMEESYNALRDRFLANPSDEHYATVFASVAKEANRIDDVISVWRTLDSLMPGRTDPAMNLASALTVDASRRRDTASFREAIGIYDRLQKGLSGNIPLASRKIQAYGMWGDTTSLVNELEKLHREAPNDIDADIFIGTVYSSINKPDSAIRYFDHACSVDSTNGMIYLARANFFRVQGDSIGYDREVFRALESPDLEFQPKFQLLSDYVVKLYNDTTQRSRIDEMFETLQTVNPGEPMLHSFYGAYDAIIGNYPAAAEQYGYSLDLDGSDEGVWQSLISVYSTMKDTTAMEKTALEAFRRFPDNTYFPLMASTALFMQKKESQALAVLDSVNVETIPTDKARSVYFAQRGDILYSMEEADSAFTEYSKAIEYDPDNYMAMNNAAYYMSLKGKDLDKAELYASIATAAEPDNTTFLDTYAWVMFKKKDYKKARELMDKVLVLAKIIEPAEDTPQAEDTEQEPEKETPVETIEDAEDQGVTSDVYDHAGNIYFMSGDFKDAVRFWEQALELDPDNNNIREKVQHKTYIPEEK